MKTNIHLYAPKTKPQRNAAHVAGFEFRKIRAIKRIN